jgi:hypothetical protein
MIYAEVNGNFIFFLKDEAKLIGLKKVRNSFCLELKKKNRAYRVQDNTQALTS